MSDPMSLFVSMAGALTSAKDIALGLAKLDKTVDVNAKAIELQGVILSLHASAFEAQTQQTVLFERVRELEAQLAAAEAWDETARSYELYCPMPGSFVYRSKPVSDRPQHWICASCFEKRKRTILQISNIGYVHDDYSCSVCDSSIKAPGSRRDTGMA